jgi:hypothetical protein
VSCSAVSDPIDGAMFVDGQLPGDSGATCLTIRGPREVATITEYNTMILMRTLHSMESMSMLQCLYRCQHSL